LFPHDLILFKRGLLSLIRKNDCHNNRLSKTEEGDSGIKIANGGQPIVFQNPRYMNGAATNTRILCGGQERRGKIKIGLRNATMPLGAARTMFSWGGREGYNVPFEKQNMGRELDHIWSSNS